MAFDLKQIMLACGGLVYCGRNHQGWLKLQGGQIRFLVAGQYTQVREWSPLTNEGPNALSRTAETSEVQFLARSAKTGNYLIVTGCLAKVLPQKRAKNRKAAALTPSEFDEEMQRVQTCLRSGELPMVDLRFIMKYVGCSASTVHRHVKAGRLCRPSKRGSRSLWPYQAVAAYAAGGNETEEVAPADGTGCLTCAGEGVT